MNIILIRDAADIAQAAAIAIENHCRLRDRYPWMPEKKAEDIRPRIEWMVREGRVYALEEQGTIRAFIGWFKIENFRNLGPGAFTPDWCSGVSGLPDATDVTRLIKPLIRRLLTDLKDEEIPIHAIGITSSDQAFLEEFSLLSYGRIVLDAARPANELLSDLASQKVRATSTTTNTTSITTQIHIRPAAQGDARELSQLDERLARHIASPPVLMPDTRGDTVGGWEEWLADLKSVTYVAESSELSEKGQEGKLIGFIKADPPHFDVSFFVHDKATLAICGLYVEPSARGMNIGSSLLRALVAEGAARGYSLISVDCETHNPEARAFWLSRFKPVTWSLERRF